MRRRSRRERKGVAGVPTIGEELRRGLARDELAVQFQPIVRTSDEVPVGLEALVRWMRPGEGVVPAAGFLEAADGADLLHQVDHRTIELVARDVARARLPARLKWISVNVASRSLEHLEVRERLEGLAGELGRYELGLVVELTDRDGDLDRDHARAMSAGLRSSGMQVALDGFGRSTALFDRILDVPADVVKIDAGMRTDGDPLLPDADGYLRALVRLSHWLDRTVVVTGVESRPSLGGSAVGEADFAQGFYFGRPGFL
jgi:EAL domain-containing protein (putative c-di-GMP-specific phosphodiesterase class I)